MKLFLYTIALYLLIEGLMFAVCPRLTQQALYDLSQKPWQSLRKMGIIALCGAIILAIFCRFL